MQLAYLCTRTLSSITRAYSVLVQSLLSTASLMQNPEKLKGLIFRCASMQGWRADSIAINSM